MADPIPYLVAESGTPEEAPNGSIPIALYGAGGGGVGPEGDVAVGRIILNTEDTLDLSTVSNIDEVTYVDVRGEARNITITLPDAATYGPGRIIYINDKLGHVVNEDTGLRITVQASGTDGIEGRTSYVIAERRGFVGLRASDTGPVVREEWQVVAANSPLNHTSGGFSNWNGAAVLQPNQGYTSQYVGAHVYTPLKVEVSSSFSANKFVVRYYPTMAMAEADKSRPLGDPVPDSIQVLNEFVVGGDLPRVSYGNGGTVSSWNANGTPTNGRFVSYMLIEGTASRFSATQIHKDMVYYQG